MKKFIYDFFNQLFRPFTETFYPPYDVVIEEDPIDDPKEKILYVIGTKIEPWQVEFLCPCGCQEKIVLPVNRQTTPRWHLFIDSKGIPSLSPSIWRSKGCKSHFFLRGGRIQWCPNAHLTRMDGG